jgi:hypothetical protein
VGWATAFDCELVYHGSVDVSELASTAFITLVVGGLGTLLWARLNRLEDKMATLPTRMEFETFKTEVRNDPATFKAEVGNDLATFKAEVRNDLATFKAEVRNDLAGFRREFREDIANLRSDLTAVALAVGVHRPYPGA